jgi:N-acetylglucosaminyldiphosphoundecaprenol N-acetyl-beta-D-mannosaminyltransferase
VPPFRDLEPVEVRDLARRIERTSAQIVWIGLGTPRQDYLVPQLAAHLNVPVVPVGAAFDFWAGRIREAPRFLRSSGFEWMHRLASEPRRLWRRYLLGNPRFLFSATRHWFRAARTQSSRTRDSSHR